MVSVSLCATVASAETGRNTGFWRLHVPPIYTRQWGAAIFDSFLLRTECLVCRTLHASDGRFTVITESAHAGLRPWPSKLKAYPDGARQEFAGVLHAPLRDSIDPVIVIPLLLIYKPHLVSTTIPLSPLSSYTSRTALCRFIRALRKSMAALEGLPFRKTNEPWRLQQRPPRLLSPLPAP